MKKISTAAVMATILIFAASSTHAADYPEKPIKVLIGFSAGGSTDITVRVLCDIASKILGQPLVPENRVGASGKIALDAIAKGAPDGYLIGNLPVSVITRDPHLQDVPFDTLKDFTPIMTYSEYAFSIAVKADSPWKTLRDLVADMKANPTKFTVANTGTNSGGDVAWRIIGKQEGIPIRQVPYAGGGAKAVLALLGNHVQALASGGEANPSVRAGQVRLLAMLGERRLSYFSDVPTLKESGYDFSNVSSFGMVAPKGLPAPILRKLENAFAQASKDPKFQEVLTKFDLPYIYKSSDQLTKEIPVLYGQWGKVFKEVGISKQ